MTTTTYSRLFIPGVAVTQGSMKVVGTNERTGRAIVVHDKDDEIQAFREDVALRFRVAFGEPPLPEDAAYEVGYCFTLPRLRSRMSRPYPNRHGSGDIDKFIRAVNDALEGWAWRNDAQVVAVAPGTCKRYTDGALPIGVEVWWRRLDEGGEG